jgi:hypothetical protein
MRTIGAEGLALALVAGLLVGFAAKEERRAPGTRPDCVAVTWQARWGASAYNHWVTVANRCDDDVRCQVSTDVNPEVLRVDVEAGEAEDRLTFRGSPAREFTPTVACHRR